MTTNHTLIGMFAILSGVAGCGSAGDSESSSSDALTQSIPRQEWFAIELGGSNSAGQVSTRSLTPLTTPAAPPAACNSATPAEFAILSHKISSQANGVVASLTSIVAHITSFPATARSADHAVWGPITAPTSPSVYRLDVQRVDAKVFSFRLAGRPKSGDESTWRGVFEGTVAPIDDSHRVGEARVDFGAAHALNPTNEPTAGALALRFQASDDAHTIELAFVGVAGTASPIPKDAVYKYAQPKIGAGSFEFVAHADFDKDGKPDELVHVLSHWAGAAGGQAVVTVAFPGAAKHVTATQCWNATNGAVFYADDASMHPPAGSPACCPK